VLQAPVLGKEPWPVSDRVMVLVGPHPGSRHAIRRAAMMAASLRAPLMALFVETPNFEKASRDAQQDVREDLEFAEDLGATVLRQPAPRLFEGVVEVARARQITHLFLSNHPAEGIGRVFRRSLADALLEALPGVDLHQVRTVE
jgi:two-component system, OmpR family, sensor histidine kinase KdpD